MLLRRRLSFDLSLRGQSHQFLSLIGLLLDNQEARRTAIILSANLGTLTESFDRSMGRSPFVCSGVDQSSLQLLAFPAFRPTINLRRLAHHHRLRGYD